MIWCTKEFDVWYLTDDDIPNYDEIKEQIDWEKDLTKT